MTPRSVGWATSLSPHQIVELEKTGDLQKMSRYAATGTSRQHIPDADQRSGPRNVAKSDGARVQAANYYEKSLTPTVGNDDRTEVAALEDVDGRVHGGAAGLQHCELQVHILHVVAPAPQLPTDGISHAVRAPGNDAPLLCLQGVAWMAAAGRPPFRNLAGSHNTGRPAGSKLSPASAAPRSGRRCGGSLRQLSLPEQVRGAGRRFCRAGAGLTGSAA